MKTINDALHMRNSLLLKLEEATRITNPAERTKMLSIVVAGGGPTGVEVAGMLAELRKYVLKKDYPELAGSNASIYLLEGAGKLLGPMSMKSHEDAYKALTKLGVNVKLNALVKDYSDNKVLLSTGEVIEAGNMIWTAGVSAITFEGIPAESVGPGKRMLVNEFNEVKGLSNVYSIGDACLQTTDLNWPKGHPQLAQTAIQHGKALAKNLIAAGKGNAMKPFSYYDKGSMAIVGRNSAVCDIPKPKLHFRGIIALFMWLFIHLIGLINPSNKFRTLFNWTTAYLTRDQSLRMIVRPERKKGE
jgi:NADH:ubiquinone reductase (H+-translocating)